MIEIDDSNINSIQEGIVTLRQKETELRKELSKGNLQKYKDLYVGKWVKLIRRDLSTYEPDYSSREYRFLKVKDVVSATQICNIQDSLELSYEDGTYLGVDDDIDSDEMKIQELADYGETTTAYSNCIEVIKPETLNKYIKILQNKIDKLLNSR